jgi:hypothetical protein
MKKFVLFLSIAALAASPALAKTKPQKNKKLTEAEEIAQQHANTLRLLRDGLPLILPSWVLPVYFNMNKDQQAGAKSGKPAKARH